MNHISNTDLILNQDGSIYHLNLLPEDIANTVITVGDPERVSEVSQYFDRIELKKGKREFITHTGYLGSKRLTVLSTGIGTDNIDIVLNELDALVNIDFKTRKLNNKLKSLDIIRIGTSGAIQEDIPMDSILVSEYGLGLDSLMQYYVHEVSSDERLLQDALRTHFHSLEGILPYISSADHGLLKTIGKDLIKGITLTAPGFYSPQGREVRAKASFSGLLKLFRSFSFEGQRITNLEMETAGIYALSKALGHKAISINAILANRVNYKFSSNPAKTIDGAIQLVLARL